MKATFFVAVALTAASITAAPFSAPASAQELNLGPIIDPMTAANAAATDAAGSDAYERKLGRVKGRAAYEREMRRLRSQQGAGGRVVKKHGSRVALSGSTRFRPSLATRKRVVASWAARARARDAKSGADLERQATKTDLIVGAKPQLARLGLRTDDVADAIAIYLVTAWYGVRGSNQDPPRGYLRGVREQMHQVLLSNARFASASNEAKQQLAESLLLETMVTDAAIRGAKANSASMAGVKSYIRQTAMNTFQLDMAKMKLTANGLGL